MKHIDAEKLINEIERRKTSSFLGTQNGSVSSAEHQITIKTLEGLLSFIESLEKEQEPDIDFEQELYKRFGQIKDFTLGLRIAKSFFELGCRRADNAPKIKGWVARDKSEDILFGKGLCIHFSKPERNGDCWSSFTILTHLPWDMFPDLKWEDSPRECELTIRKV